MTPGDFIRRRAIIEHRHGKTPRKRNKALRSLEREARAKQVYAGGKLSRWVLPSGKTVCLKYRYRTEDDALFELSMQQARTWGSKKVPVRVYLCGHCHGWHLTSQPKA